VPFILNNAKIDEETVIIGHSAGASVILSLLEEINVKIKQAILVAGFPFYPGGDPIVKQSYDWKKISNNTDEIIFINSDNDPYGHNEVDGRMMLDLVDKKGAIQIILKGVRHMSVSEDNSFVRFPLLLRLVK